MSAIVVAPKASIVSLETISTGDAPSVALPLIKEPVTTTSSTCSSCALIKLTRNTDARRFNFKNFIFLPFINKIYIPFISKKEIYTKKS
ncbi:MAG: malate dehydrogenase [SAR86 cluster bacterium SAR86B]|uniref:Malate dehydrogenase n=1 Tax=SAR86 cluster bacterium SAR86B TaxID=1123867 RepID=J5KJ50_9GAMM|nr:MAG: malate dehydrogenase [SAR86 cluster bacterium SAR86B]